MTEMPFSSINQSQVRFDTHVWSHLTTAKQDNEARFKEYCIKYVTSPSQQQIDIKTTYSRSPSSHQQPQLIRSKLSKKLKIKISFIEYHNEEKKRIGEMLICPYRVCP